MAVFNAVFFDWGFLMRAVIQRVAWAQVDVDGVRISRIEHGLLVLLGIARGDHSAMVNPFVEKLIHLRIFPNDEGRFDRSVRDVSGAILVVSQFTLLGDMRKGRRPNFQEAAPPEEARKIYESIIQEISNKGIETAGGIFQSHMHVSSLNDGPVTLILDLPELQKTDPFELLSSSNKQT